MKRRLPTEEWYRFLGIDPDDQARLISMDIVDAKTEERKCGSVFELCEVLEV